MKCAKCGKEIPDKAKFCPQCGTKMEIGKQLPPKETEEFTGSNSGKCRLMYCAHCGKEIKPGANFCGNCGTPVVKEDYNNKMKEYIGGTWRQAMYKWIAIVFESIAVLLLFLKPYVVLPNAFSSFLSRRDLL